MLPPTGQTEAVCARIHAAMSQPHGTQPRRILAVKLADLGDVLNITPALRALRQSFPQARIDVLVNPHTAVLLQDSALLDGVVIFPKTNFEGFDALRPSRWTPLIRHLAALRGQRYDTVVNFHHLTTPLGRAKQRLLVGLSGAQVTAGLDNGHGAWFTHTVRDEGFGFKREVEYWLALAASLGASSDDLSLDLPISAADKDEAARHLAAAGLEQRSFAVLHPGSGGFSLARRWDPPKFATLAAELERRYGLASVLVGGASDGVEAVLAAAESPLIDLSRRFTIQQLAAVLASCRLFVGADSGVMHIAAAMRAPLVALFGPTNHLAWAPWTPYSPSRVVRLGIPCSPCAYVGHSVGWRHGCLERTCLANLDASQVMAAVEGVMEVGVGRGQDMGEVVGVDG